MSSHIPTWVAALLLVLFAVIFFASGYISAEITLKADAIVNCLEELQKRIQDIEPAIRTLPRDPTTL